MYSDFLRGYFDGDGHISKGKFKYNMSMVGTQSFCESVQSILNGLGIESHIYITTSDDKPTRTLMITKKRLCKKFFDYIYKDANLKLQRKYGVYIEKYCSAENINNPLVSVAS